MWEVKENGIESREREFAYHPTEPAKVSESLLSFSYQIFFPYCLFC